MLNKELKVEKARGASEQRRRSYWPRLSKTEDKLILGRPHRGNQKNFAAHVKRELVGFLFDGKENRWEADLTLANHEAVVAAFVLAGEVKVKFSDDAQIWADCAKAAKGGHERYKEAGGQQEYCREKNALYYRQKAAQYKGKLRRYYLGLAEEREKPDSELSCEEWQEKHGRPCGGHKTGCTYCPAEE